MITILALLSVALGAKTVAATTPTLWLIGDSTMRNVEGEADVDLWGWGDCITSSFDIKRIRVMNLASGGRSSRTFFTEGKWDAVAAELNPGDFVLMQFGHNDAGRLHDNSRTLGSLDGIGAETETIDNVLTKKPETVHTYGWYLSHYIQDAKAKSTTPIVCSPIPRCPRPGTTMDANTSPTTYRLWAQQVAVREGAPFIDLYQLIWSEYAKMQPKEIKAKYFCLLDYTHTNHEGAEFNASKVVDGIRALPDCSLKDYLLSK
jgi:rhamnogalacturonan acetylesterase